MIIKEMRLDDGSLRLSTEYLGRRIERIYMGYSDREAYKRFRQLIKNKLRS